MSRFLVLGERSWREELTEHLEETGADVVDCDPALGDCVMYVRLEGLRYDAFFFAGFEHPVTRGALAIVADRAVLLPLLERGAPAPDATYDGYLFRLPRALAFRDEAERDAVLRAVPKAAAVPSVIIGRTALDRQALTGLVEQTSALPWHWETFVEGIRQEVGREH